MVAARLMAALPTHLIPRAGALASPTLALGECRHCRLTRRLVAVRRAADVAVVAARLHH
jgi:hypothetical protein